MNAPVECIHCIIKKSDSLFCKYIDNEEQRLAFTKKILKEIGMSKKCTAPYLNSKIMNILKDIIHIDDLYVEEKKLFNNKMLSLEKDILKNINKSKDKLLTSLKYAMVGNFIDFGAMESVDCKLLDDIINTAQNQKIDFKLFNQFKQELLEARKISYLLDNAGEVVFDKLFIKALKEYNKKLKVDIVVRGKPALNDVTYEDAIEVGIDKYGDIIENGTDIPGTDLNEINAKTLNSINSSDFIISKGQGNFETLCGSGKNIYYIFLCKCDMFVKRFSIKKYDGVFIKE